MTVEYAVVRSGRRRRTLSLSLNPDGQATVAVPMATTVAEIEAFVAKHAGWLVQRKAARAAAPPRPTLDSGTALQLFEQTLTLQVERVPGSRAEAQSRDACLRVSLPDHLEEAVSDQVIRRVLGLWYRRAGLPRMTMDTQKWAEVMDLQAKSVQLRDQKHRWGSCSSNGSIRYNWRLAMLPSDIVDYVIVHELAHLRQPNHSKAFWAEVARFIPNYADRRARLNKLTPTLVL